LDEGIAATVVSVGPMNALTLSRLEQLLLAQLLMRTLSLKGIMVQGIRQSQSLYKFFMNF